MQTILTIYHDGQFWIAFAERYTSAGYSVAKCVLGDEPSDAEIIDLIIRQYDRFRFSDPVESEKSREIKKINPKRAEREIARTLKQKGVSTKAQDALRKMREEHKIERIALKKAEIELEKKQAFALKQEKKKKKKRGH